MGLEYLLGWILGEWAGPTWGRKGLGSERLADGVRASMGSGDETPQNLVHA